MCVPHQTYHTYSIHYTVCATNTTFMYISHERMDVTHCTKICLKMCFYNSCLVGHLFGLCFFVHYKHIMQLLVYQIKMPL